MAAQGGPSEAGAVENTAFWVAKKRCIEASRPLPLINDPVIAAMVPDSLQLQAWQQAELDRLQACTSSNIDSDEEGDATRDTQAVMTLTLRCRYIDDEILALLHAMRERLALGSAGGVAGGDGFGGGRPAIQVVLLGAGLDTRPWRLPLGRDISWFEVDLPDMAAFKRKCMARAGMQAVTAGSGGTGPAGSAASSAQPSQASCFPLRVGSWASLAADLRRPPLLADLVGVGYDPTAPTLWVIEGVIYYLGQQDADRLIKDVTAASLASGLGAVVVSCCDSSMIQAINSVKGPVQGDVTGAVGKWWFEAEFPDYEATLGDDPCITLKKAGWEAAHVVSMSDLEAMYQPGRSTRLLPAAAEERATRSNGDVPPKYLIVTATIGMCD